MRRMSVEQYEMCESTASLDGVRRRPVSTRYIKRTVSGMMRRNEMCCELRQNWVTLCDKDEKTALKDLLGSLSFRLPEVGGLAFVPIQCPVSIEAFVAGVARKSVV